MSKLCKRLGDFKPGDYPISPSLPPEPVDAIAQQGMIPEWQAFRAEQQEAKSQSDTPPATEASRIFGSLKTQYLAWRRETLPRYKKFGLPMLNIVNHCLKVQYQQVKRVLWQAQKLWRTKSGRLSFEQWLRKKGKTMQANLWHSRTKNPVSLAQTKSTSPSSQGVISSLLPEMEQFVAYANAVDADRYRVTSIRLDQNGDKQAFILDKHNGQSRGFTPQEMAAHMPEMLRLQRRGENIYYTPLSDTKHHILVDDMTQDSLTRFKADGFRPAVILESSPGNFQCLLTIPKLGTPHDRVVGNRLTERLNKKYGDPKLSGCIHPHRAPGFENRKPKHRAPDGTFPPVRLLHAEHCQCDMALEISRTINSECEALASKRKSPVIRASSKSSLPLDPVAAYYAHFDNIKSKLAVEDYSRVDAMIAVRMRATGHLQTSIAYAIQTCAPTIRTTDKTGRNWERYAERTANYAFGPSGDAVLVKYEAHIGHWRRLEGQEMPQEPPVPRMRM